MRILIILTILATLFQSCERDTCNSKTQNWKDDANGILAEFQNVNDEIKNNYQLFEKGEFGKGKLFIRWDDSVKIANKYGVELPKLKAWFKGKDWGYISYKDEIIEINYRECNSYPWTYHAYLYYSKKGLNPSFTGKLVAEIKDSISLGNDWYFIRTGCKGCGD